MLKLLFEQNFKHQILRGLVRRISDLDYLTTEALGRKKDSDQKLLEFALKEMRVIVTHDKKTFRKYADERVIKGEKHAGVLIVPDKMPIGDAINELEIITACCEENEFENRVEFLPFLA